MNSGLVPQDVGRQTYRLYSSRIACIIPLWRATRGIPWGYRELLLASISSSGATARHVPRRDVSRIEIDLSQETP